MLQSILEFNKRSRDLLIIWTSTVRTSANLNLSLMESLPFPYHMISINGSFRKYYWLIKISDTIIGNQHSKHALDTGSITFWRRLSIREKLSWTFGLTKCTILPVLIKSWPDDRQDRQFYQTLVNANLSCYKQTDQNFDAPESLAQKAQQIKLVFIHRPYVKRHLLTSNI